MDEQVFEISCEMCDTHTEVIVIDVDEAPCFCPMCGVPVEA